MIVCPSRESMAEGMRWASLSMDLSLIDLDVSGCTTDGTALAEVSFPRCSVFLECSACVTDCAITNPPPRQDPHGDH